MPRASPEYGKFDWRQRLCDVVSQLTVHLMNESRIIVHHAPSAVLKDNHARFTVLERVRG